MTVLPKACSVSWPVGNFKRNWALSSFFCHALHDVTFDALAKLGIIWEWEDLSSALHTPTVRVQLENSTDVNLFPIIGLVGLQVILILFVVTSHLQDWTNIVYCCDGRPLSLEVEKNFFPLYLEGHVSRGSERRESVVLSAGWTSFLFRCMANTR